MQDAIDLGFDTVDVPRRRARVRAVGMWSTCIVSISHSSPVHHLPAPLPGSWLQYLCQIYGTVNIP